MSRLLAVLVFAFGLAGMGQAESGEARYAVEVEFSWVAPEGRPANPHWSRLIAFAHTSKYDLFRDGDTASSGLALLATNGRVSVLEAELDEARRRNRVGEDVVLPGIAGGTGAFHFEIAVTPRFSRLSFGSMLAPSPDWFSGVSGLNLRAEENWVPEVTRPLWVWDAGVDSGQDYTGPDLATQPRQSVRLLAHSDFLRPDGLQPIGRVTLTLISEEE